MMDAYFASSHDADLAAMVLKTMRPVTGPEHVTPRNGRAWLLEIDVPTQPVEVWSSVLNLVQRYNGTVMSDPPFAPRLVNNLPQSVIDRFHEEHPEQKTAARESDVLYHGTNTSPEHTEQHGLVPGAGLSDPGMLGEGVTHAVFMTPDAEEAAGYGRHVWRVDGRGLDLEAIDGPEGYHYVSHQPIPPERLSAHR